MITFDEIIKANKLIETMDLKGKDYCPVNQRIKAFRAVCPDGFIHTEMTANDNGICVFRAEVGYFEEDKTRHILGTGTAYEKESSSFVNKTSYIENCETSAVGRALGMAGFGIDTSIASAEEVQNAILNQGEPQPKPAPKSEKPTSKGSKPAPKAAKTSPKNESTVTEVSGKNEDTPLYVTEERLEDLIKVAENFGWDEQRLINSVEKRFKKSPLLLTEEEYKAVFNGLMGIKGEGKEV